MSIICYVAWHFSHMFKTDGNAPWLNYSTNSMQEVMRHDDLPSVLWRCWLGSRKGIRPVKIWSDEVLAWLSVWSEVQMICIWFSRCHCHPVISCFSKIQNGLSFWYWPTQVVLEKRLLNGCVCVLSLCLNLSLGASYCCSDIGSIWVHVSRFSVTSISRRVSILFFITLCDIFCCILLLFTVHVMHMSYHLAGKWHQQDCWALLFWVLCTCSHRVGSSA